MKQFITNGASMFSKNRKKFMAQMESSSLALFHSNDVYPTGSSDGTLPFKQNTDLLYLSGVDQEETILLLFPDAFMEQHKEILFIRKTSAEILIWEGEKLTIEKAQEVTGIKTVLWLDDFEKTLSELMIQTRNVYVHTNHHLRANIETETRERRFINHLRDQFPTHQLKDAAPILHYIRSIKEPLEIELMQKACDITNKGFRRILQYIQPGVMEYELEAEYIHEFIKNGSRTFAYEPIIASGWNACCLHYQHNNKECKEGDMLLMDVGAEFKGYAADMTRTIPVSGAFTQRQKDVYGSVLKVMKEANTILRPGVYLHDYHREVGKIMESELLTLGLITKADIQAQDPKWPAYKQYFMHGTSHFIGLDVHDVGLWHKPLEQEMVLTIEPGIYIPKENLGVRIENDVVLKAESNLDLMKDIPREIDEIETLMNS